MHDVGLPDVRAALALENVNAVMMQRRMAPQPRPLRRTTERSGPARQASVLLLLYPGAAGLTFVLTRRSTNPHDVHSGQISLPGGSQEAGEGPIQTALRETHEELGVQSAIAVLGELTLLYIPPSDFEVHPVVGSSASRPVWYPDRREVDEVLEYPVAALLNDDHKVTEEWQFDRTRVLVPWYNVQGHKVWGATAMILSEFELRLKIVLNDRDRS